MPRQLASLCLFVLSLAALCLAGVTPVRAQTSSRVGRVLTGLSAQPAVLLGPDRAYVLGTDGDALPSALCSEVVCRPVVRAEACTTPRCPGAGRMVFASERISDVSDFPTDYEGYTAVLQALYAESALSSMTPYFTSHPSPPRAARPARFSYDDGDNWHLELGLSTGLATGLVHISQPMWEVDATLSLRFRPRHPPDDGLDVIYGTSFGPEIRTHVIGNVSGQSPNDMAVFIGLGPAFAYVDYDDTFRIPPAFSWLAPEFGVVIRTDGLVPPAWYVGWSLPMTVLLDEHLGLEARLNLLLVDDWYSGDDAELLGSLNLGFILR